MNWTEVPNKNGPTINQCLKKVPTHVFRMHMLCQLQCECKGVAKKKSKVNKTEKEVSFSLPGSPCDYWSADKYSAAVEVTPVKTCSHEAAACLLNDTRTGLDMAVSL